MTPRDVPRVEPIFFYSDNCPLCEPTLVKLIPLFTKLNVRLTIRKPTLSELRTPGFKFPALLMPAEAFDLPQTILMVGSDIPQQLESVLVQTKKIAEPTITT